MDPNASAFPYVTSTARCPGITIRAYFAGLAMEGICASESQSYSHETADDIAESAVKLADALIEEPNKPKA